MIVTATQHKIVSSDLQQISNFSIKANAKAFSILSDGLYSDKILAIIRELSCNAYDSHVDCGYPDRPIEIKLPNSLDPTFHVKDFGTGLSHEQIVGYWTEDNNERIYHGGLYNTYFESSKQDSNDFIGALGLGSKSPFSYVSNFIVESRQNGIKRIYSCFKDNHGLPAVTLMGTIDTEEENGLTVKLSAKQSDNSLFVTAAKKALMYFNPIPNIVGVSDFHPYYYNHTLSGTNWKLRESDYWANISGPQIVQGFVCYPIDKNILGQESLSNAAKVLIKTNIDLFVPIGDVEVAASREQLSYDPRTLKNLVVLVEGIALELRKTIQQQFDDCKSAWEAGILYQTLVNKQGNEFKDLYYSLDRDKKFLWNNLPITTEVVLDSNKIQSLSIQLYDIPYSSRKRLNMVHKTHPITPTILAATDLLIVVDPHHHSKTTYTELLQDHKNKFGSKLMLVIRPHSKKRYIESEVDYVLDIMDNSEFKLMDALIRKTIAGTSYTTGAVRKQLGERAYWVGFPTKPSRYNENEIHRKFSYKCWKPETIDLVEGGYYVDMFRNAVMHNNKIMERFDNILEYAYKCNMLPKGAIFGFSQSELEEVKGNPSWLNIFDVIHYHLNNPVWIESIVSNRVYSKTIESIGKECITHIFDNWYTLNYNTQFGTGEFYSIMVELYGMYQVHNPKLDTYSAMILESTFGTKQIDKQSQKEVKQILDRWDNLKLTYPMLTYISFPSRMDNNSQVLTNICNYIALVDNCENQSII